MTWWLQGEPQPAAPAPTTPDLPLASMGEGLSAAFATANRNSNVFNEFDGRVLDDMTGTTLEVVKRLGPDAVKAALAEQGLMPVVEEPLDATFFRYSDKARDAVLKMGEDAASLSPDQWKDLDLTRGAAEARVTDAQKKEAQEQAQIIAMSPYPATESIIGGIASAVVDPRQWPLMLINPGGSFLKTVGWQAALGVAGEAITLPSQMDTAERLGEPAPNALVQLGLAAAGGGILGGLLDGVTRLPGIVRGIALQMERSRPIQGATKPHVEAAIAAAENALVRDAPIEPAIRSTLPPEEPAPIDYAAQWREADATTDWEALLREAQSRADEPQVDTAPNGPDLPPDPPTRAEQRAAITSDLNRAEAELAKTSKWFSRYIKKRGGIHPESPIADELRNAGITHKTMPGLFSRKGAHDLDNLDLTTDPMSSAMGIDGNYLSRQGAIDGLITELTGGRIQTPHDTALLAEADNLRAALRDLDLEDQIDTAAGPVTLTQRERTYIKEKVAAGDDIETAIGYALERSLDDIEAPEVPSHVYEDAARWEQVAQDFFDGQNPRDASAGNGGDAGYVPPEGAAGGGGQDAGAAFSVETTPAGQQTLIPGTEVRARDTSRDKALAELQAKQSKMRRLDQVDPDGMFAPKQMSLFDDPTSTQATAEVDAQVAELRASLDPENPVKMQIEADDGRVLETDQDVVREIDEMDQLEREFSACLTGGVNVGA